MVRQPRTRTERVVKTFIENLLPLKYLVSRSNAVKNYRLRGNKSVNLSFEEVLSKPFFTGETLIMPTTKPKPVIKIQAPKPKTPVNKEAAKARAIAILKMGKAKPKKRPGIVRARP
jgi:cell envelope opacity-associated protein A